MKKLFAALTLCWLWLNAPAHAQLTTLGYGLGGAQASGGGCTQATAFLARVTTTWSVAYTTMICAMVSDGTWAKLDLLYIWATDTAATAQLNLVNTSFSLTPVNSPVFVANTGYSGNGVNAALNSTYDYSTGTNYVQNSASVGVWSTGTVADNFELGTSSGFNPSLFTYAGGGAQGQINSGTNLFVSVANGVGLVSASRTTSALLTLYKNGSSIGSSGSNTSSAPVSGAFTAFNSAGADYSSSNVALEFVGGGFTSTDETNFYNDVHTFLHTVNATLYP